MIEKIQQLDTQLFIWLNGLNTPWLDVLMHHITERNTWIPLYVVLLAVIIWQYKRQAWGIVASIFFTILIADQFTSSFLKPVVERLRPCYVTYLQDSIHLVGGCGGRYGFASSHAANSFGLAMLVWLMFRHKWPYTWLWFLWAAVVSYSRIYVGVHYPLDVFCGAMVGIGAAYLVFNVYKRYSHFYIR